MAAAVQVPGLATIQLDTGSSHALETLGYTRNQADTSKEAFWDDIPGDENGGDKGPPIEIMYLGEIARVRLELTKFDATVAAKIKARTYGGTAGAPLAAGPLIFAGGYSFRLLINSPNDPRNFPTAFPRGVIEVPRSTRFQTLVLEFECHKRSGVLYNAVTA